MSLPYNSQNRLQMRILENWVQLPKTGLLIFPISPLAERVVSCHSEPLVERRRNANPWFLWFWNTLDGSRFHSIWCPVKERPLMKYVLDYQICIENGWEFWVGILLRLVLTMQHQWSTSYWNFSRKLLSHRRTVLHLWSYLGHIAVIRLKTIF